jgi:hypothetical protein
MENDYYWFNLRLDNFGRDAELIQESHTNKQKYAVLKNTANEKLQLIRPTYYGNWTLGETRPMLTLFTI